MHNKIYNFYFSIKITITEVGEVERFLNKKVGSKPSGVIDFASRFVLLINSKFKIITNLDAKSTLQKALN
jgi:hypothetical protein